ncbi:MAG: ROK family protein [Planctomycetota bacterium]
MIGLDIGGSSVKVAAWDGRAWTLSKSDSYAWPDGETLRRAVASCLGDQDGPVGLSVPGVLSDDRARVLRAANVPGLVGLPLRELVGRPVVVTTDQIAAAVDIAASRKLRGRLLSIAIGSGVGAAVLDVSDEHPLGVPLRVNGDSPGHLGQIDVSLDDDPPVAPDGGAGGVEAYLGGVALVDRDATTLSADEPAVRALVRLLRIAHAIYRPNHIVLSGGIGRRLSHLADAIVERTSDRLTNLARDAWTLGFGDDDHHAARGAARWALQSRGIG